jgi:hypothetical protein
MNHSGYAMRMLTVLFLAVSLLAASLASADAVVVKNRILVGGRQQALWVPLSGGPAEIIYSGPVGHVANGAKRTVATDGERFLVTYCGSVAALYEEDDGSLVSAIALAGEEQS